jgi:glycosyltransferase involved in cell wall biosynthesis
LKSFQPDLVHIATEGPLGWAALHAARHLGLPVVSSYHSNFSQYLRQYGFGCLEEACWRYLRWFHNGTQVTFCPTPSIRDLLLARGFREVRTWGRGVDSGHFHPEKRDDQLRRQWGAGPDTPVILYVGRLAAEKNVAMLLDAFGLLPDDPAPILVLVGDGPLRSRLEKVSGKRVVFAGYRQGEELARSYASADLFVFPSLTDTFGNVLLEGMAAGLPAVGFCVPGPKDVIRPGETGLVVNSVGAAELAQGMKQMLEEPVRRQIMGEQARSFALTRSWPAILGSLRQEYDRAVREAGEKTLVSRGETNGGQTGD